MTNESAILGLLADLYRQNAALADENAQLRADRERLEAALASLADNT